MIPYILAENPKISQKNAFFLSKQLTKGNKWKLFLLDLSFLGWELFSLFTLGILDIIYVRPYKMNCKASLYLFLRRNYVLSRAPKYEQLNDSYLEHVPSEDELLLVKHFMTILKVLTQRSLILRRISIRYFFFLCNHLLPQ